MGAKKTAGKLRIIGGAWRGRRLPVVELPGLRPTTDRIRETLFNWLAPELAGSRCLDLFAGTGALGLEALSRDAASCDFVEQQQPAASALAESLQLLGAAERGSVLRGDALNWLQQNRREEQPVAGGISPFGATALSDPAPAAAQGTRQPYDLVFLDPPFAAGLLTRSMRLLEESRLLGEDALIYVEYPVQQEPDFPGCWRQWRSKRSSAVVYELYRHEAAV